MIVFSRNKETKPKKRNKKKKAGKKKKMHSKIFTSILPFTSAFIYANEEKGKKRDPHNGDSTEANVYESIEYEDQISDYEINPAGDGEKSHQNQRPIILIVENQKKNNAHGKPHLSNFDPNYYQRNQGLKLILEDTNENYGKSYNFFNSHHVRNGAYDQNINTKHFQRKNKYKKEHSLEALYKDLGYRPQFRYQKECERENHNRPTKYKIEYPPHLKHHQDSFFQFQHQNPSQYYDNHSHVPRLPPSPFQPPNHKVHPSYYRSPNNFQAFPHPIPRGPTKPRHYIRPHHPHVPPLSEIPIPQDAVVGKTHGSDFVGDFEHHTGSLGPFGFYANYFETTK
jgi:hypothetical protein